jgi:hypothetical protein
LFTPRIPGEPAVLLGAVCLGAYTRYAHDDYCWAETALSEGVIGALEYWYNNWLGRFTVIVVQSIAAIIGPETAALIPPIMLLLWWAVTTWMVWQFVRMLHAPKSLAIAFFLATLGIFTIITSIPNPFEALYWQSGMLVHLMPLVLLTLYLGLIGLRLRIPDGPFTVYIVASIILTFLAGGCSEIVMVMQLGALLLASLFVWRLAPKPITHAILPVFVAGLLGATLAATIMLPAPGNLIRSARFPEQKNLIMRATTVARGLLDFFTGAVIDHPNTLLLLLCLSAWVGYTIPPHKVSSTGFLQATHRDAIRLTIATLEIGILLLVLCFSPGIVVQIEFPARSMMTPQWILTLTLISAGYFVGVWLHFIHSVNRWRQWRRVVVFGVGTIAVLLVFGPGNELRSIITDINISRDYAAAWDARDEAIRATDSPYVETWVLDSPWQIPTIGPNAEENKCQAAYYDLELLIAY